MWQIPVDTHTKKKPFFLLGGNVHYGGNFTTVQPEYNAFAISFTFFSRFFKIAFKNKEIVIMTVFQNSSIVLQNRALFLFLEIVAIWTSHGNFDDSLKPKPNTTHHHQYVVYRHLLTT